MTKRNISTISLISICLLAISMQSVAKPCATNPQIEFSVQAPDDGQSLTAKLDVKALKEISDSIGTAKKMYSSGKIDQAIQLLQPEIVKYPKSDSLNSWLGFLYLQNKQPKESISYLQNAVNMRPDDIEAGTNLASAFLALGDYSKAESQFEAVSKLNPNSPEIAYNLGTVLLKLGKNQEAKAQLKQATKLNGKNAFAFNNLGISEENLGEYSDAGNAFAIAYNLQQNESSFAKNAGFAYYKAKDFQNAAQFLSIAFQTNQNDVKAGLALADSYVKQNRLTDAIQTYDQLRSSQENNSSYWFNLGYLRQKSNDMQGAVDAYKKCLQIEPNEIDALNNLAALQFKAKKYRESEILFLKLSGLDPTSTEAERNVAASAINALDYPVAINVLKDLAHKNPNDVNLQLQLANVYNNVGQYEDARIHYNKALKLNPRSAEAENGLGLYSLHKSDLKAAYTHFFTASQYDATYVPALDNLALTLEKLNHVDQAIRILKKAHALDPTNEDVTKNLNRMTNLKA